MAQCRGVDLPFAKVPQGISTESCVLYCFGFHVARLAAASSASFARPFCNDLHQTSRTSPPPCTVLPVTSRVLWRGARLTGLVIVWQCTFLLLRFLGSLVFVPSSEQTFKGSQVVVPDPSGSIEILPRRLWLVS